MPNMVSMEPVSKMKQFGEGIKKIKAYYKNYSQNHFALKNPLYFQQNPFIDKIMWPNEVKVSSTNFQVTRLRYQVSSNMLQVSKFKVTSFKFQASIKKFQVTCFDSH